MKTNLFTTGELNGKFARVFKKTENKSLSETIENKVLLSKRNYITKFTMISAIPYTLN